ncbi:Intracellular septation protein [Burkholderiales bacterium]|nr:MAG: septation protein A [Burkholderiales bacterium]CAG1007589.1 Intracellular septation protein [Burkholderiales bacterium]
MKLFVDFLPLILFFVAFKLADIYVATAVAIVASLLQIGWFKFRGQAVSTSQWLSLAVIVVFGGATLLLHDDTFIKWKPTVLYWVFGGVLAAGKLIWRRDFLRKLIDEKEVSLPEAVWGMITWSWVCFFAAMGVLNLYVAFNWPLEVWVNFKVWGGIGLTLFFVLAQGVVLSRYIPEEK